MKWKCTHPRVLMVVLSLMMSMAMNLVAISTQVIAASYTLEFVAKTGDVIGGKTLGLFAGEIDLNESGVVAFRSAYTGGSGAFTQNDFIAGTGSLIDGKTLSGVNAGGVAMNDSGIVAFRSLFTGGEGIFTQNELIAEEGVAIDGMDMDAISTIPDINNAGIVTFTGIDFSPFTFAIFTKTRVIAKAGDTIMRGLESFTLGGVSAPSIDNLGNISFTSTIVNGVFVHDGTSGSVIKVPGDTYGAGLTLTAANQGVSALNAAGHAAFPALISGSPNRRMVTDQGIIATVGDVVDGGALTITAIETTMTPDINDAGTVVYRASTNLGGGYIFAGQDAVLGLGTVIDGITLSSGLNHAINNQGQIAIRVAYSGGSGIVLATPIPEPSSFTLAILGLLGILKWSCQQKRIQLT